MTGRLNAARTPGTLRPAVFLDRDGTLIHERGWVLAPADVELIEGAAEAVARLNRADYTVVLVTNQSAIGRGLIDAARLAEIHAHIEAELARHGAHLDGIEYCPDHPTAGLGEFRRASRRRKPEPGMLLDAAERLGLDLARSFTIGDAERDLVAGRRAGVRGILVATGKGGGEHARLRESGRPHTFVPDLAAAVAYVLEST